MSGFCSLYRRCSFRHWAALVLALTFVAAPAWSAAPIAFDDAVDLGKQNRRQEQELSFCRCEKRGYSRVFLFRPEASGIKR